MPKVEMDTTDHKILRYLMKNARMPFLEIARECGISGAAIHQRVKKLTDLGVINGTRLVVSPKTLGFDVCAIVGIKLQDPSYFDTTVAMLKNIPEIVDCYFITGQYNIFVKVYCRDNEHMLHTILDGIMKVTGIASTETFISLAEVFSRQVQVENIQ